MADVRLSIANREYIVTCNNGEEPRLKTLGAMVDEMAREAGGASGGLNESRLLLFSALLLADKLHDVQSGLSTQSEVDSTQWIIGDAANTLENLADRLEKLADALEQ